mgnify:CR=1 FL=1
MKRFIGIVFSALLFGVIAGTCMVGINYLAQSNGIYHILAEGELSQDNEANTKQENTQESKEEKQEKKNPAGMIALSLILILGLAGGAFYYFKFLKPKQDVKGTTELDEFDFEDYEDDFTEDDNEDDFTEDDNEDGEEALEEAEPDETV